MIVIVRRFEVAWLVGKKAVIKCKRSSRGDLRYTAPTAIVTDIEQLGRVIFQCTAMENRTGRAQSQLETPADISAIHGADIDRCREIDPVWLKFHRFHST